jgi:hypothetical protein
MQNSHIFSGLSLVREKNSSDVNFIKFFARVFSYERRFGSFSSYMYVEKAAETTFVLKMRAKNT